MADNLNEQVGVASPVETTDHGLFDFKNKDDEGKPIKEETLASEFDEKYIVSDPVEAESKDNKNGGVVAMPRSYSSRPSSSDEEGDDEEKKQRKKEKKGLKEKLVEKLPGHNNEDTHVPIEEPHVQEVVYSEPPHTEEDPQKKAFLDKIKEKLPGQNKTDDHHVHEAVPVVAEPVVEGEEDKKGFMDKIKEKIPAGLCSSNTSDDKNDHEDK